MIRIVGVDLPEQKKIRFALRSIFGLGDFRSVNILKEAHVDEHKRTKDLTTDEANRIQRVVDRFQTEGNLRREVNDNIDRLKRTRSYRGLRHISHLPVRGQRTRTNSRSARGGGKRKTVGSLSKEMAAKLEETPAK
ncbi:MAG: 30S ribosomal protein S13 [Candidatus Pacebacteria bacterium RIFCSPHIGHO2_01_FULL_46_16]|nr:MAG: 30S ribosomal protein S13 [Candidatus Pacebacteria bacterium RIFCSPHIGHO2_01_FULL_46_16]OGJ22136.1 MAG: 30S ribosomal protein S13 [Candidatus Pacebacteria bacterium RIFCSPHIGHO2_02_FULL_46_9]OGJ38256.1 MAG: 30S ribosomal protein S13 [Candidatus Pacebacteria bacterium RIFCSPLOWO2_01_FULL_47_12]